MKRKQADPLDRVIEEALQPGRFIGYGLCSEFVVGLERARDDVVRVVDTEPARAIGLIETFILACYEKMDEVDDSDGSMGSFIQELFGTWVQARQANHADPKETIELLLEWREKDDYGCCHDIEKTAVEVLDRPGLAALEGIVLERRAGERNQESYDYRWLSGVLRLIYARRRDARRYLELAEETGLTPADCMTLSGMYETGQEPEEALSWVERGIELQGQKSWGVGSGWGLADQRLELLAKLGRVEEAIASAWSDFEKRPAVTSLGTLMKFVPGGERSAWRPRVLAVAESAGLSTSIDLFVELKEPDRLSERVREATVSELEGLSHYVTEPAATELEEFHPEVAAKLYRAMALRILNARKSRYYDAALRNLAAARECYRQADREAEWTALVRYIRTEHRRKSSFMPGFEALLRGRLKGEVLSMVDRAREQRRQRFAGPVKPRSRK